MKIEIEHIDPTTILVKTGHEIVKGLLSYKCEYWRPGQYSKVKSEYEKSFLYKLKKEYFCYAGFAQRIKEHCQKAGIEYVEIGERERLVKECEPNIPGVELRDYQLEGINKVIESNGGVLQLGTGLGKTKLAVGLISCFPSAKVLVLCPNLDLTSQFHQEFVKYGFDSVIYSKTNKALGKSITCTNIQIFSKADLIDVSDYFDICVIDEIHLCSKSSGSLSRILSSLLVPLKVGLTATLPEDRERYLTIEGLVGKLLMDKGAKVGAEEGHLAKPRVGLISYPSKKGVNAKTYQEYYKEFIVNNPIRNRFICNEIKELASNGESIIAFFVQIDHIKIVSAMLKEMGVVHNAVYGEVGTEERDKTKADMTSGESNVVLSSVVWREGISISRVSVVIVCGGQQAEGALLQAIGRGLRKMEGKEECLVIDFLDDQKYLSSHCVNRISTYVRNGWL